MVRHCILRAVRVSEHQVKQALLNLTRIVEAVPLVVLEHHALRDESWRVKLEGVFERAEAAGHKIVTAAEYAGQKNMFLEANTQTALQRLSCLS